MGQKNCSSCGEKVNRKAKFCEFCGQLLVNTGNKKPKPKPKPAAEEPVGVDTTGTYLDEFDSRESAKLSHEYFERHIEILASYRKRLKMMAKGLDNREMRLAELSEGAFTEARTKEIQGTLESIEGIGDEWEDLQLSYNQDSEVLDEEFQERFAEMEIDVELPEDLQEKMSRELDVMMRSFDKVGQRISTVGTLGNRLISQASGRWFDGEQAQSRKKALVLVAVLTGLATFVVMRFGHGLDVSASATAGATAFVLPILFISRF